jgi:hypothetical protein
VLTICPWCSLSSYGLASIRLPTGGPNTVSHEERFASAFGPSRLTKISLYGGLLTKYLLLQSTEQPFSAKGRRRGCASSYRRMCADVGSERAQALDPWQRVISGDAVSHGRSLWAIRRNGPGTACLSPVSSTGGSPGSVIFHHLPKKWFCRLSFFEYPQSSHHGLQYITKVSGSTREEPHPRSIYRSRSASPHWPRKVHRPPRVTVLSGRSSHNRRDQSQTLSSPASKVDRSS